MQKQGVNKVENKKIMNTFKEVGNEKFKENLKKGSIKMYQYLSSNTPRN